MSNAGARGPSPPKPPAAPPAARPVSPTVPGVAPPRGVAPARVSPQMTPTPVARTTAVGASPSPRPPVVATPDDAWEEEAEEEKTNVVDPAPPPPPVAPAVAPVVAATTPRVPAVAAAAQAMLTAEDLRIIVREMIDQAVLPLQHRLAELERRPRAPSAPAIVVQQPVAAPAYVPAPPPVAAAPAAQLQAPAVPPAPITYASAIAAPASAVPVRAADGPYPASIVPAAPRVDLAALARDLPMDFDVPFDGRKRKRRMVILFVLGLLVVFGGLAFLLIDSYSHTHN